MEGFKNKTTAGTDGVNTELSKYAFQKVLICFTDLANIQGDSKRWTQLNSKWHLNTCQTVAVFQVLCSLYSLTCVGYAQNSLEFVSHSPLIHVVSQSFCLYTDSLFAQIGDSNDKYSSSLEVEC